MSQSVQSVAEQIEARRKTEDAAEKLRANRYKVEIACRDIMNQSRPTDAEDLLTILSELGETLDHYRRLLDLIRTVGDRYATRDEMAKRVSDKPVQLVRLEQARMKRRYELDAHAMMQEHHRSDRAAAFLSEFEYDLSRLTKTAPELRDENGQLLPCVAAYRPEPRPVAEVVKHTCKFCGGRFNPQPHASISDYCSYVCSDAQREWNKLKGIEDVKPTPAPTPESEPDELEPLAKAMESETQLPLPSIGNRS